MAKISSTNTCWSKFFCLRQVCGGLAVLAFLAISACSTVRMNVRSDRTDKAGIHASQVLQKLVSTPEGSSADMEGFANAAEVLLKKAKRYASTGRIHDAAGCYLKVAFDSRSQLTSFAKKPGSKTEQALLDIHNNALARFAEIWAEDPGRQKEGPYLYRCEDESFEIVFKSSDFELDYFDRAIAAKSVKGRGVSEWDRSGYGAALVGIRDQTSERADEMRFYSKSGFPVTMTLTMGHPRTANRSGTERTIIPLSLKNPMSHETVQVDDRNFPLAANFSTRFKVLLNGRNGTLQGLRGFISANKRIKESGIFISAPYDPNRIPVVFTHGLASVPFIWRNIMPELMSEPDIARRYQFMIFTYPSSVVIVESARMFRENLAELRAQFDPMGKDPLSNDMIAVGHSMGGILTHILVADLRDHLWRQISDKPIESLGLSPEIESKINKWAYFDPDIAVNRVVFISTPHRGAKMAETTLPAMISASARLPFKLLKESTALWDKPGVKDVQHLKGHKVTGMQSLEPDSPIIRGLNVSPYNKGVVYHSIIGDRGRGDTPNSSDGVVDYASSHQDGAASEIIVPTDHAAYSHRMTIDEIKRILRAHSSLD